MRTDAVLRCAAVGLGLLAWAAAALACGDRIATRGGQVNDDQGEMNFELVSRARTLAVYLEDHGHPVSTQGAVATATIRRGASGWSSKLQPSGNNRFVATLPSRLERGDSVSVSVSFPNGSIADGHFTFGIEPQPRQPSFSFSPRVEMRAP